jgi:hypothetical protein
VIDHQGLAAVLEESGGDEKERDEGHKRVRE